MSGDLCQGGCGPLDACRFYYSLARRDRGVQLPAAQLAALGVRLCSRNVVVACHDTAYGYSWTNDITVQTELCALSTHDDSCELAAVLGGQPYQREAANLAACAHGITDACRAAMIPLWEECDLAHLAPAGEACIDALVARREGRAAEGERILAAWDTARTACADGDADACLAVPGRAVSLRALCDAGDAGACHDLRAGSDEDYDQRRGDVVHAFAARIYLGESCAGGNEEACARARALDKPCAR